MTSLLGELRRRNVIKVAALYVIASWLILQVAQLLFDVMELPPQWLRLVLALLILVFPLVLIFSWVYELTPEGLKRERDIDRSRSITSQTGHRINVVIVVLLVLAIAAVGIDRLMPERVPLAGSVAATGSVPAGAPSAPSQSIAVLPFADLSPTGDQEYFSEGIAEEILNVLVRIDGLKVASRTTSWGFKGQEALGIPLMAQKMNVNHVLEGSVRKAGDTVRITAQLIDAETDQHLWSQTYDRQLTAESIFSIQDEIAQAIVQQLGMIIEPGVIPAGGRSDTESLDAYELFLEAQQLFTERRSFLRAADLYERAVAIDPEFARAWAGLAALYWIMPDWGFTDRDYIPMSREAAEQAIELNDDLSLPYAVLAALEGDSPPADHDRAFALFDEALSRDPQNTTAYLWRTVWFIDLGYFDRASADAEHCLSIDPAYEICRSFLAMSVLFSGDIDRAIELNKASLRNGFYANTYPFLFVYAARGEELPVLMAQAAWNDAASINVATTFEYRALFDPAFDFDEEKIRVEAAYFPAGKDQPVIDINKNEFLFLYGRYDEIHNTSFAYWWFPYPEDFRNSTHRKRLMRELGVSDYWREHGFPDRCRPVGEDDFECD